ncbi:sigma factor-like helix-turn-helix DNA-binding protein [Sphingomonas sp. TDK1]|uniref:sigma factor-like helix-turn-helix DNA-binding protein n=1 Tax=Sphingomonas sp. TDK1 TaxID=453247 RepID=UPI000B2C4905|nr:sigma factor-like helix-turn-helix DNA-binding protein [Sphingomonas sp. TDK1]
MLAQLSLLPEDQRAVLLHAGVKDLSDAEAAAVLEVPAGTAPPPSYDPSGRS